MKPPPFEYVAPTSIDEAVAALAQGGIEAKVLAGGQSLVPLLNFRLARPALLVDLNRVAELLKEGHDAVVASRSHPETRITMPTTLQGHCWRRALQGRFAIVDATRWAGLKDRIVRLKPTVVLLDVSLPGRGKADRRT